MKALKKIFQSDHLPVIILLLAILLVYPVMAFVPGVWFNYVADIKLFQSSTITLLSLAFILFRIEKVYALSQKYKLLHIGIFLLTIPAFIHYYKHPTYTQEHFLLSIKYAIIPYCVYLYSDTFKKYLSWFLILFWTLNFYVATTLFIYGVEFAGIPGNRNWHATFLIITTPFLIRNLYIHFRKNDIYKKIFLIVATIILGVTCFGIYHCFSRAAYLAFGISFIVYLFSIAKPAYRKIMIHIFAALIAISAMYAYSNWDTVKMTIEEKITEPDIRLPMWRGCIELAKDNFLIGVGEPSFETEFAKYRGIDYFVKKTAAVRSNHPHNHFFYYLSSNGFIAFFIWGTLIIYPLIVLLLRFKKVKSEIKLVSIATIILIIHGSLDLPLYEWPTNMFFLLFLGILWREVFSFDKGMEIESLNLLPICAKIVGVVFIGLTIHFCYLEFNASYYTRVGLIAKYKADLYTNKHRKPKEGENFYKKAILSFNESTKYKYKPKSIYKAATTAFINLQDIRTTGVFLKMLLDKTPNKNYAHNNGLAGMALFAIRKPENSISSFQKEIRVYPLTVTTRYFLYLAYKAINDTKNANKVKEDIFFALKIKGLSFRHLALVIDNAKYDFEPDKIPGNVDIYSPKYMKRFYEILNDLNIDSSKIKF